MDIRLGLSLLLLLANASYACSKTSRDGPTSSPRQHQQHHNHQHHHHHPPHRHARQLQRNSRALSEFLVPPPFPANFRGGPRGPPPPPKNNNHNQPPPPPLPPPPLSPPPPQQQQQKLQHPRSGRYVNQGGGNNNNNNNNGPGYLSKLMTWINPFGGGNDETIGKDSVGQGASSYPGLQPPPPASQYAPHQPYTGGSGQYEPPPHPANLQHGGPSNLAPWINGKPCNPCNQIPWIPVLGASSQQHSGSGQYAPNTGGGGYLAPPPPQEIKQPDFSHSAPPGNLQQHYPIPNPHLYPGSVPPLFKAKPFNVAPEGYSPPNLDQPHPLIGDHQPSQNFDHQPPLNLDQPPSSNFDHQPPQNFDHQPPPSNFNHQPSQNFDHQPPPSNFNNQPPQNFDHQSSPNLNHQPSPNFNHQPEPNFDQQPPSNYDHPPSQNFDQQPPSNYDHPPSQNFDQQPSSNFDHQPPQNFDHQPSTNFNHQPEPNFNQQPPSNYDQPPSQNFDQNSNHPPQNFDQHPSQNFADHPPSNYDSQQSSNYNYQGPSNFDSQPPGNYEDQHPQSNFEQHHQPSQIVDVVKEPPSDLNHSNASDKNHQEPDNAESRPVFVNSVTSSSVPRVTPATDTDRYHPPNRQDANNVPTVHFQRSPLIDLSVAGESFTTTTTTSSINIDNRFRGGSIWPTDRQPVTIGPTKGKPNGEFATRLPPATLIDYIVSGVDDSASFGSSEEEKETRPQSERTVALLPTVTTTTTTTRSSSTTTQRATTTIPVDQRRQESLIETLVQSYEFYKQKNGTRGDVGKYGGRFYNETEDSSASREVVAPSKSDNGKKIIQIIIPYTSQYTPSPFHPTRSIEGHYIKQPDRPIFNPTATSTSTTNHHLEHTTLPEDAEEVDDGNVEDNVVIQESRRVSVTRTAPNVGHNDKRLRNENKTASAPGNTIDVHRLQKNIDNWTIQEYSKPITSVTPNSTYPRWLSSKQIPDEYLLSTTEFEDSNEYYDFNNDTELHRRTNKSEVTTTPQPTTKASVITINATYPKNPKKPELPPKRTSLNTPRNSSTSERVYVVTPIPNPNSLEDLSSSSSSSKSSRALKPKHKEPVSVERAYQVLPQAVNNLAVLSSAPDSAAPALWGIMEHEEFAASADQPRWRSENDELPEPASTPILYAGHSKVSRAR